MNQLSGCLQIEFGMTLELILSLQVTILLYLSDISLRMARNILIEAYLVRNLS